MGQLNHFGPSRRSDGSPQAGRLPPLPNVHPVCNTYGYDCFFPLLFPSNLATIFVRLQYEIYWLFNGESIQGIIFPFNRLNLSK
jgi:hypothetical protein